MILEKINQFLGFVTGGPNSLKMLIPKVLHGVPLTKLGGFEFVRYDWTCRFIPIILVKFNEKSWLFGKHENMPKHQTIPVH